MEKAAAKKAEHPAEEEAAAKTIIGLGENKVDSAGDDDNVPPTERKKK